MTASETRSNTTASSLSGVSVHKEETEIQHVEKEGNITGIKLAMIILALVLSIFLVSEMEQLFRPKFYLSNC